MPPLTVAPISRTNQAREPPLLLEPQWFDIKPIGGILVLEQEAREEAEMLFLSWLKRRRPREMPRGPDELIGMTETGKTLVGVAVVVTAFGALSWVALTLAQA